jgi:hypothetical protein
MGSHKVDSIIPLNKDRKTEIYLEAGMSEWLGLISIKGNI